VLHNAHCKIRCQSAEDIKKVFKTIITSKTILSKMQQNKGWNTMLETEIVNKQISNVNVNTATVFAMNQRYITSHTLYTCQWLFTWLAMCIMLCAYKQNIVVFLPHMVKGVIGCVMLYQSLYIYSTCDVTEANLLSSASSFNFSEQFLLDRIQQIRSEVSRMKQNIVC